MMKDDTRFHFPDEGEQLGKILGLPSGGLKQVHAFKKLKWLL